MFLYQLEDTGLLLLKIGNRVWTTLQVLTRLLLDTTGMHKERWSGLLPWPQRLTAAPPRLEEIGVSSEEFHEDTVSFWDHKRVSSDLVLPCFLDLDLFVAFLYKASSFDVYDISYDAENMAF